MSDTLAPTVNDPASQQETSVRPRRGGLGPVIAIVILVLAVAGTVVVWMVQPKPGRDLAQPSINDFFPIPFVGHRSSSWSGTSWYGIDRIMLVRFIAMAALFTIFIVGARRVKVVPGRFQAALEWILDFVRKNIAVEVLGEKLGKKYFNVIMTIFITIFALNVTGIVPFLNIAGSSRIGIPLIFALWVFVLYVGASVKKFGVGGFLKVATMPPGVPKVLYVLLIPVEFLQTFLLRPATLTVRLLANMIAGHLLLALCFFATSQFFFSATTSWGMRPVGILTFAGGAFFFALEAFVAALQAYVFAILTAIYLQMVVDPEH